MEHQLASPIQHAFRSPTAAKTDIRFPVPLKTYDESLGVLRRSLEAARLGHTEKLEGFRRLDRLTRKVEEEREPLAEFDAAIRHERAISSSIGGRTVFDDKTPKKASIPTSQLGLF